MAEKWDYLEQEPAPNAPLSDNPSGMYCPACRECGLWHCASPEWCGGMRLMRRSYDWLDRWLALIAMSIPGLIVGILIGCWFR